MRTGRMSDDGGELSDEPRRPEPVSNMLAVRYKPGHETSVRTDLAQLGEVTLFPAQRLLLAIIPESAPRNAAMRWLQQWLEDERIEFVTPVLRDLESQLIQIPTDEITVRFKPGISPEQREQIEKRHGVSVSRQNEFVANQFVVKLPKQETRQVLSVADELNAEQDVEFATPNFISQFRR